jgi:hypothetical protein
VSAACTKGHSQDRGTKGGVRRRTEP